MIDALACASSGGAEITLEHVMHLRSSSRDGSNGSLGATCDGAHSPVPANSTVIQQVSDWSQSGLKLNKGN